MNCQTGKSIATRSQIQLLSAHMQKARGRRAFLTKNILPALLLFGRASGLGFGVYAQFVRRRDIRCLGIQ